jgi:hypothetical protein
MRNPDFTLTTSTIIFRKILFFLDHWFLNFFISPIAYITSTVVVLEILTDSVMCANLIPVIGQSNVDYLKKHQIPLIFLYYIFSVFYKKFYSWITKQARLDGDLDKKGLLALINSINNVVQNKKDRFLTNTKDVLCHKWGSSQTFDTITKPEQQISLIVTAVQGVFEAIHAKVSFRVGLIAVENLKKKPILKEWFSFAPNLNPPKTSIKDLSSPNSTVHKALELKNTVIVSDIRSELIKKTAKKRFIKGNMPDDAQGSIMAKPIYCPNTKKPIYILSIIGNKKNCLLESNIEFYNWILDHYILRIVLEHHLFIMKEAANAKDRAE